MIFINNDELSAIKIGDEDILYVYRGDELLWESIKRYGGLTVYKDNTMYPPSNGYIENSTKDEDFFTIIVDTGDTSKKKIEFGYTQSSSDAIGSMRIFNKLTSRSIDYWTVQKNSPRTLDIDGRWYVISVSKADASYFFVKNATTGEYYANGKRVN